MAKQKENLNKKPGNQLTWFTFIIYSPGEVLLYFFLTNRDKFFSYQKGKLFVCLFFIDETIELHLIANVKDNEYILILF